MRIYIPATLRMLRDFFEQQSLQPLSGTAFALTPALREAYSSGGDEELEYAAMREAARASLRLISGEQDEPREAEQQDEPRDEQDEERAVERSGQRTRRVVVAADVQDVTLRPDLDHAVVRVSGQVPWKAVAAVHVDTEEAEQDVHAAVGVIDAADLGDEQAELTLGDAEDHELAWFAPQEVPFLLELM
ncbi:DUF6912 family protein [Actinopolyspora saharensis]|uniref:Uncharacterized protein n=1 Tax=Actinopolyspora saharensis TaxID=995062 RepID=A0A1H1E6T9_9ACTN|nr:hypothetical protein [Actinopolyspora saharensis]SDQ84481.1 hypothetical protein SAMN04489718_2403 [Actinopolyspora saharensis]